MFEFDVVDIVVEMLSTGEGRNLFIYLAVSTSAPDSSAMPNADHHFRAGGGLNNTNVICAKRSMRAYVRCYRAA